MRKILIGLIILLPLFAVFSQGLDNLAPKSGPDIGLKNIGIRTGVIIPATRYKVAPGFGIIADLGTIVPKLGLAVNAEYWSSEESDTDYPSPMKYTVMGGGFLVRYLPEVEGDLKPHAGLGFFLNNQNRDYPENLGQEDEPSEFRPFDPQIEIGADYPLNEDLNLVGALGAVFSNPSFYSVRVGITYNLEN